MTLIGVAQIVVYLLLILAVTKPLGTFMTRVFEGERTFLHPVLRPLEKLLYKLGGVREDVEQRWTRYAASLLSFSLFAFVILYAMQRLQAWFPFNPQRFGATTPDLAFNTSVSFLTNTNWQSYVPETTMSYFVQMAGLAVQNFASAAVGIAVAIALIRGFARQSADAIGNFWVDLVRVHGLRAAAAFPRCGADSLLARGHPELQPLQGSEDGRGRQAGDPAGAGGIAGSHQDAGDQRRRVLQRELRASLRESHASCEPPPDVLDLRDPRRA